MCVTLRSKLQLDFRGYYKSVDQKRNQQQWGKSNTNTNKYTFTTLKKKTEGICLIGQSYTTSFVCISTRIKCNAHIPKFTRTLPNKQRKKQKKTQNKPRRSRFDIERRINDICNNANPPTFFKTHSIYLKGNVTELHFTNTRNYTDTERDEVWCERRELTVWV